MASAPAKELTFRGANVLITYVSSASSAEQGVVDINSSASESGKAASVRADCRDLESPRVVVEAAIKAFDGEVIDIIVNNAGVVDKVYLKDATYEHFDDVFPTNVCFPMFFVKESLSNLKQEARIVNIGSVVASQG